MPIDGFKDSLAILVQSAPAAQRVSHGSRSLALAWEQIQRRQRRVNVAPPGWARPDARAECTASLCRPIPPPRGWQSTGRAAATRRSERLILAGPALAALWPALWFKQWTHLGQGAAVGLRRYRSAADDTASGRKSSKGGWRGFQSGLAGAPSPATSSKVASSSSDSTVTPNARARSYLLPGRSPATR